MSKKLKKWREKLPKVTAHILICCQKCDSKCAKIDESKRAIEVCKEFAKFYEEEFKEKIMVTKTSCLKVCESGPIMAIYPEGIWYHSCDKKNLRKILTSHFLDGEVAEKFLLGSIQENQKSNLVEPHTVSPT